MTLKDEAFSGKKNGQNPYLDGIEMGIAYDTYEASVKVIVQKGNFSEIRSLYGHGACKLIEYMSVKPNSTVLDIGSGTGISTLELLNNYSQINAIGIETSEGMLAVAKYKFNLDSDSDIFHQVNNPELLEYWNHFKNESQKYIDKIKFIHDDFQFTNNIDEESIDFAFGNQSLHWTDLSKSFNQLNRFLKNGSSALWNSASHFYEDSQFPSLEYGFRYNDFLGCVLDNVAKHFDIEDYKLLSRPEHNVDSINELSKEQGLNTQQIGTYLIPVDLQVFIKNHVPVFVGQLVKEDVEKNELEKITNEAIANAINNPFALSDSRHKYDIIPVFESKKV